MAARTTVHQARAEGQGGFDCSGRGACQWSYSLGSRVFALKELPSSSDSAKGIAVDDEQRGVGRHKITTAGSPLLSKKLVYSDIRRVGRDRFIRKLRTANWREPCNDEKGQCDPDRNHRSFLFQFHGHP